MFEPSEIVLVPSTQLFQDSLYPVIENMIDIFQVDSFTDKPFTGNPAGVCILENEIDEITMQNIAMEMAVSETAFCSLNTMGLRWFSPKVEVSLCGHATLATTAVLYYKKLIKENQTIQFNTLSGSLSAKAVHDCIQMDFPLIGVEPAAKNKIRFQHLGIDEKDVVFAGKAGEKDFLHLKNDRLIREISPDFEKLVSIPGRSVIVTSESSLPEFDFISRNFAPWIGVNEDPVTGSTHCALAYYWSGILEKSSMTAFQASERGGVVNMKVMKNNRIQLSGKATITIEGVLKI